ncbi:MAG: RNA 2',3'-cyclic phosphodiesterase [Desulfobacterales bacterium]|nr:RNA 2',3'-cyclic phosphodiesterase [Desulfobacterales bacterium]
MGKKIRAFIAISVPEPVLEAIAKAQDRLRRSGLDIRWVRKEGIHLTLKFLGNIDVQDAKQVRAAMELAVEPFSPFTLRGEGIGFFPDLRRPRVVWAGLSGDVEDLKAFQGDLESRLKPLGFAKEKRPFKGHLTLGRVKGHLDRTRLSEAMEALEAFQTESFTAESVVLFQSDLRPGGAVYSRLAEVAIKSA